MKAYIYKFNLGMANLFSIVILVLLIVLTYFITGEFPIRYYPFLMTTMILYFILHEILHGIGYMISGAKPKNVYFGIALEKGILYCLCRQEVKKKCILTSLQMPFTVIGLITYIVGIIIKNDLLTFLSIANLVGASMDLVMFFYIARIKNVRYSETDANDEFVLITDEDLTKKKSKFFNLKETKKYNKKDYEFDKMKRVTISVTSLVILLACLGLDIISMLLK